MDRPVVPDVLPVAQAYVRKRGNEAGGSLHLVLDDGNVADAHIQGCIDLAESRGDEDGAALGRLLLAMTRTQRGRVVNGAYAS